MSRESSAISEQGRNSMNNGTQFQCDQGMTIKAKLAWLFAQLNIDECKLDQKDHILLIRMSLNKGSGPKSF